MAVEVWSYKRDSLAAGLAFLMRTVSIGRPECAARVRGDHPRYPVPDDGRDRWRRWFGRGRAPAKDPIGGWRVTQGGGKAATEFQDARRQQVVLRPRQPISVRSSAASI